MGKCCHCQIMKADMETPFDKLASLELEWHFLSWLDFEDGKNKSLKREVFRESDKNLVLFNFQ